MIRRYSGKSRFPTLVSVVSEGTVRELQGNLTMESLFGEGIESCTYGVGGENVRFLMYPFCPKPQVVEDS